MMRPQPGPVLEGQESVWSYPRPAIAEPSPRRLRIIHKGQVLADTEHGVRTLETSHPPTYYFPRRDIAAGGLRTASHRSLREWKGQATYFDVLAAGDVFPETAWSYSDPTPAFESLRDHVAFYAALFGACFVDDERVRPQPGGFYGGWITSHEAGPFKGVPGSRFW